MKRIVLLPALLLLGMSVAAAPASAQDEQQQQQPQQQGDDAPRPPEFGTVTGSVVNATGAAVAGATVTLSAGEQSVTDENGQFQFSEVPPGGYSVGIEARGFQAIQISVNVRGSNESRVDVLLQPGS